MTDKKLHLTQPNPLAMKHLGAFLVADDQRYSIEIYTDGSCSTNPQHNTTIGLGWHATHPVTSDPITFSGACKHFSSSTKAEAYAIYTALLICPPT
ncbi:ribonuclease H-like domain-containing protein [Rhizophagus clarus]|uniref:Ribonuclease H-like domain-containing protein n=1 Tax=Rhizophagus clarus TaxID=94130 RepID=A0A8H3LDW0_9GLOM|nr:ribonuclease H-like domain-containing protein [Rhizophagus clarus]